MNTVQVFASFAILGCVSVGIGGYDQADRSIRDEVLPVGCPGQIPPHILIERHGEVPGLDIAGARRAARRFD